MGFKKKKETKKKETLKVFLFSLFLFLFTKKNETQKVFLFFLFETHNLSNLSIFSFSNPFNTKNTKPISSLTHLQIQVSIFVSFSFSLSYQCLSLRSVVISSGRFQWWVVIFVDLGLWVCGKFDCVFP